MLAGGLAVAGLPIAAGVLDGQAVLEKIAQRLLSPVGLIWIGLLLQSGVTFVRRRRGACLWSACLWGALTTLGSGPLIGAAYTHIEAPFVQLEPLEGPLFDALVVLGGGTSSGANRRTQVNDAGDRIVLAAQLYHAGKARRIVCTGRRIGTLFPNRLDPAEESALLLESLNVPATAIDRSGGANTAEELRELAESGRLSGRVGLLTSAWHMRRALRLARAEGLQLEPVPADFDGPSPDDAGGLRLGALIYEAIPTAEALSGAARLAKEHLAEIVGR